MRTTGPLLLCFLTALTACAGGDEKSMPPLEAGIGPPGEVPRTRPSAETSDGGRPAAEPEPRVYAKSRYVWIRPRPTVERGGWIGYLWVGGSARLRETEPRRGPGCATWYAVEPRGFVCVDGDAATLDANDPGLVALREHAPAVDSPWPHSYGESRGARLYTEPPTGGSTSAERALPRSLQDPRRWLNPRSTVAWSAEATFAGTPWLLTADYKWVRKDRVTPYPHISFHGLELGKTGAELPLAWFRDPDRPKYRRVGTGVFEATGEAWKRLSWVGLTGRLEIAGEVTYYETTEAGHWVARGDASIPTPPKSTPWGDPIVTDGGKTAPLGDPVGRTWLEVSVWKGWLIAYVGRTPVYTTLISPGRGGTPVPGKDPLTTASTPTGTFKITGKFKTATMVAPNEFIHSDVPWTQNFSGPHTIHGTYWHDDWGNRKSAGCINASPADAKWLFEFTEPRVPEGWHAVRWRPGREEATTLIVHR